MAKQLYRLHICGIEFPIKDPRTIHWSGLQPYQWVEVLKHHPEYSQYCSCWTSFTGGQWGQLLEETSNWATYCDLYSGWKTFSETDWVRVLLAQPQLAKQCTDNAGWGKFYGWDWAVLLLKHPQFFIYVTDWEKLCKELYAKRWVKLTSHLYAYLKQNPSKRDEFPDLVYDSFTGLMWDQLGEDFNQIYLASKRRKLINKI